MVKQAFSFARAKRSGVWHDFGASGDRNTDQDAQRYPDEFPDDKIWSEINLLKRSGDILTDTYEKFGISPFPIFYEEMLDSKVQILNQSFVHLFPNREIPTILDEETGKTRKLASTRMDPVEISFVRRNCVELNKLKGVW